MRRCSWASTPTRAGWYWRGSTGRGSGLANARTSSESLSLWACTMARLRIVINDMVVPTNVRAASL
jgi:hypothetical protein